MAEVLDYERPCDAKPADKRLVHLAMRIAVVGGACVVVLNSVIAFRLLYETGSIDEDLVARIFILTPQCLAVMTFGWWIGKRLDPEVRWPRWVVMSGCVIWADLILAAGICAIR